MSDARAEKPRDGKGVVVNHEVQFSRGKSPRPDPKGEIVNHEEQRPRRDTRPDPAGEAPGRRR